MSDPDDTRTLSEKRSDAAKARWQGDAHPLFLYEAGERPQSIGWINVRRYSINGPVDSQRVWPATELQSDEDLFQLFGGGSYELLGRASLPTGQPGAIVKKRRMMLEGPPKPFASEQVSESSHAAAGQTATPGHDVLTIMMTMAAEDRRDARAREERREAESRAAEERRMAREEERSRKSTELVVHGLGVVAGLVTAIINRPAAPVAPAGPDLMPLLAQLIPKPDGNDPLEKLSKVLEIAKKIGPAEKTESIPELLQGLGEAMSGFAQVEGMRIEAAKQGILHPPAPAQTSAPPNANGNAHPTMPAPPPPMLEPSDEAATLSS